MEFTNSILQLSSRIKQLKENIQTEEATKNALIMPFIQILGYDVFNPSEVIPEFTCDIGTKKGEKVDYAIMQDNKALILIECKHWGQDLNLHDNQLLRYYNVSNAHFGVLTNGVIYKFYADLKEKNKMDDKPFFEINIEEPKEHEIKELSKFHKAKIDLSSILDVASGLKYTNELRSIISKEITDPSPDLVRLFMRQIYDGVINQNRIDEFTPLVKKSISTYISDQVTSRIKSALDSEKKEIADKQVEFNEAEECSNNGIVTTQEEIDGYNIVKAILYEVVDVTRITERDAKSYFAILFDDNNRKPICRLHFNYEIKRYISIFDEDKVETRYEIESLNDIYKYSKELRSLVQFYLAE